MCAWRRRDGGAEGRRGRQEDHARNPSEGYGRHHNRDNRPYYHDDGRNQQEYYDDPHYHHHQEERYDPYSRGDDRPHGTVKRSHGDREFDSQEYKDEPYHHSGRVRDDSVSYGNRHAREAHNTRLSDEARSTQHSQMRHGNEEFRDADSVADKADTYGQRHKQRPEKAITSSENTQPRNASRRRHEHSAKKSNTDGNSATILVRNLGGSSTSEDVESAVSDLCIKNGFSAPNSVTLRTSQSGYSGMNDMYTGIMQTHSSSSSGVAAAATYGYGAATAELFAVVTFPSPANAARFMECVKSRKLSVNGVDYYVEYDTLDLNADTKNADKTLNYNDMTELAALMKKRIHACDWMCPSCHFVNFARRQVCLTCSKEKPSEEVLQSHNLLVDAATTAQAQPIHTNVTDLSPWVVLKSIPLDADPSKLVFLVCSAIPGGAAQLQRCIYVIDTQPQSRCGFMFCQFAGTAPIESYLANRGDKLSEILPFQDGYLRLDTVRSLEKQVAEEVFKNIKMNTLKVNYEFNNETFQMTLLKEEPTAKQQTGNIETRSCKIKTTNVGALEQTCSAHYAPPTAQQYLCAWLTKSIWVPCGKLDTAKMTYDPKSDYFYDHRLGVYYDAASDHYISLNGVYYTWDEGSSSLILATQSAAVHANAGTASNCSPPAGGSVAGLLEAALKAAQMTNESTQKSSSTTEVMKPISMTTTTVTTRPTIAVSQTFDVSDDECDMELDTTTNTTTTTEAATGSTEKSEEAAAAAKPAFPTVKPLIICFVCLRVFEERKHLEIHERRSEYHRAMVDAVTST